MTRVVTDTTSGLSLETTRRLGIPMVPQIISFGDQSYREGIDIDFAGFMDRLRTCDCTPKTAAPYVSDFIDSFAELTPTGDSIVCIHPSSELSGTVRSAAIARESFPGADIRIIDTRVVAGPLGMIVLEADRLARSGAPAGEVEQYVQRLARRARIYFMVDTLEFLRRGGRIGGAAAFVGSLLQIKPLLTLAGGRVEPFERERTKRRALARMKQVVADQAACGDEAHLVVMHTGGESEAEARDLARALQTSLGAGGVVVSELVPAVVTHSGPGTIAVGFFTSPDPEA